MEIYLDNAATTKVLDEVADIVTQVMTKDYGNPSSLHIKGIAAEGHIRNANEIISATLKCSPSNIIYTSGGTESNNQAIIGTAYAYKRTGKHIITTVMEHPSVINTCKYLEGLGWEVTYLEPDNTGRISEADLKNALRDDTVLVSVMSVNNETGTIQSIAALSEAVKKYNPKITFHTDAVQAYGKLSIIPKKSGIDLMSVSAHKLHGPKGVGFLYVGDGIKLHPYIHGGGQQRDMRSGTENTPGIAGLSVAVRLAYDGIEDNYLALTRKKDDFIKSLSDIPDIKIHGNDAEASPYIISIGIKGIKSEVLLHALEDKKIYVSSGSACSSNHPGVSKTLMSMGTDKEYLDSTIRISLSRFTTDEELKLTAKALYELIPALRRFTKR